ncbi:MAG: hypothetical protein FWH42_06065 [Dehalococcoidia bacterium]|nr:hypothetical protein [Dehalococcoidia bacterium]
MKFKQNNQPNEEVYQEGIRIKLMIRPRDKVCLFHARHDLLPPFMLGDLNLMLDWAEDDCDSIVYWLQKDDRLADIAAHLEKQIRPSGRIWLVVSSNSATPVESVQNEFTERNNLKPGKTVSIGGAEIALLFVRRKSALEEPSDL